MRSGLQQDAEVLAEAEQVVRLIGTRNAVLHSLRCLGERGFALLTQRWRTLQRITASPSKSATSPAQPSS